MELRLNGKVALVTGSSSGIGRGIAERFAASGADVTVTYHGNRAGADETAERVRAHGRRAEIVQVDVGDEAAVERLFAHHLAAFGRIDILVNNAGMGISGAIHELATADWERVLRTNLYGPFFCARLAARAMIERGEGGRILNIGSVHEEACWPNDGAYCVAKAGLRNLTRTQAIELGPHGITVNGIAPGMILTSMNRARPRRRGATSTHAAAQIVAPPRRSPRRRRQHGPLPRLRRRRLLHRRHLLRRRRLDAHLAPGLTVRRRRRPRGARR